MNVSLKQLEQMQKGIASARKRVATIKDEAERAVGFFVSAGEVSLTSFGLGVVNGRYENPELVGVPLDLGTGLVFHAIGYAGIAEEHMHSFGNGGLGSYFSGLGMGVGNKMLEESKRPAAA